MGTNALFIAPHLDKKKHGGYLLTHIPSAMPNNFDV